MDDQDRLFEYWLSELRQRESSNVAVVSITTSASLVMLVLFLQPLSSGITLDPVKGYLVELAGLLVGVFGIIYRELSKAISHEKQIERLKEMMPTMKDEMKNFREGLRYNGLREAFWRLTYLVPASAWIFVIAYTTPSIVLSATIALLIPILYVPFMRYYDRLKRDRASK